LTIKIEDKYEYKIRFANHGAEAFNSMCDLEVDTGFWLNWEMKNFECEWEWDEEFGMNPGGDDVSFSTNSSKEMSLFMAQMLVKEINLRFK